MPLSDNLICTIQLGQSAFCDLMYPWLKLWSLAGLPYDANAYWNKASSSQAGSSADTSGMSSRSSRSGSSTSQRDQDRSWQPTADDISLAAAVAAVAVAAEAALEADDAVDELPYLPETAVADATSMTDAQTQEGPNAAVAAVQAGYDSLATAVKGFFGPNQASSDPGLLEVAVVAENSAGPRGNDGVSTDPPAKPAGMAGLRQKSRSERKPRLLLLPNGLLMALPATQAQPAMPLLQDDKQLIADSLKASDVPAKHSRKGSEASVNFKASPAAAMAAKQPLKGLEASVRFEAAADAPANLASLRRASVTSQGSDSQAPVSALRSKSFSAGSKALNSSTEGRVSPSAMSANCQSPFHKAAMTQISQHVERSSASVGVHTSAGTA